MFTEWMAYYALEPFGEERADLRMGILAALTHNIHRVSKDSEAAKPEDYMPKFEKPEPMSREDAIAALDLAFTAVAIVTGGYKPE